MVSGYPSETYDFISDSKTITVRIEQNNAPDLTVTNPNEFIGFTFGPSRVKTSANTYKNYDSSLYKNAPADKINGLFITVEVSDLDVNNYLKGTAVLKSSNNTVYSTSKIIWSNGSNIIKSSGTKQTGYIFFPKNDFLKNSHTNSNYVEITLNDYIDSEATVSTGTTIIQKTISKTDLTSLLMNVDNLNPSLNLTLSTTEWTNQNVTITAVASDTSGIWKIIKPDNSEVNSSNTTYTVSSNGVYSFTTYDNLGNSISKTINVSNIDKVPPVATATSTALDKVKLSVTDNLSGIKAGSISYQFSESTSNLSSGFINTANNATLTVPVDKPYLHVKAQDNAGNSLYSVLGPFYQLMLQDFRIVDIVNPPANYNYPINTANMPVVVKAGYNVKFQIDVIGVADSVTVNFVGAGTLATKTITMQKVRDVSATHSIWEGTYYTDLKTPPNTAIVANVTAKKGSATFNYNSYYNWNGTCLRINGSALEDVLINRIY